MAPVADISTKSEAAENGTHQIENNGVVDFAQLQSDCKLSAEQNKHVVNATQELNALVKAAGVPDSHGLVHCLTVLDHMRKTIKSADEGEKDDKVHAHLTPERRLSLCLAALLHETDDKKYFPKDSRNAEDIVEKVLKGEPACEAITRDVVKMISYVSASANGNKPYDGINDPTLLWPRYCDRLEAIGTIGAYRCWQYTTETGESLHLPTTPRPQSEEEVWSHVTEERWNGYSNGVDSASMMDHYFDKLLHIGKFDESIIRNTYLCSTAAKRVTPLVSVCVEFGKRGEAPVDMIKAFQTSK